MLAFENLPECIFLVIQHYLSTQEYRNTLNTCQSPYFQQLKKTTCCYYLTDDYTKQYLNDTKFQDRVLSLIEKTRNQLGLNANRFYELPSITHFSGVSSVKLPLYYLSANGCQELQKLRDLSVFSTAKNLRIDSCHNVTKCIGLQAIVALSISQFSTLSDITSLANCRALSTARFHDCPHLWNINSLAHVKSLDIDSCPITNGGISELGSHLLYFHLEDVSTVTNINHLVSLRTLSLKRCFGLTSIANLPYLSYANIEKCTKIASYSNLLSLVRFTCVCEFNNSSQPIPQEVNMNPFTLMTTLRKLHLCGIVHSELNIHLFQQVTHLRLSYLDTVRGITEPMPNLQVLVLHTCRKFKTVSGLQNNRNMKVEIFNCKRFSADRLFYYFVMNSVDVLQLEPSEKKEKLKLSDDEISEIASNNDNNSRDKSIAFDWFLPFHGNLLVPLFKNIRFLQLTQFSSIHSLSRFVAAGIHKIPILSISNCSSLTSLYPEHIVPEHEQIALERCDELTDVSSIRNVPAVLIVRCPNVTDIRPFRGCARFHYQKSDESDPSPLGYEEMRACFQPYELPEFIEMW